MRYAWREDFPFDKTKVQERFEKMLGENGFNIKAWRAGMSFIDYKLEKDGINLKWSIGVDAKSAEDSINCLKLLFKAQKALEARENRQTV